MVPKLVADFAPEVAPDCASDFEGDSAGSCGGKLCAQLAALDSSKKRADARTPLMANPEMLWPREVAELRSAWTLRLRSGQACEGARPHTSKASRSSGCLTMNRFGFDDWQNATRCSQKES